MERWPELRMLRWVGPHVPRLVIAGLAAVGTELAGVALTGTATWLIVRAAGQPPIAALAVAIVAVRALASARGVLRYAERLAGHGAALRVLAELRGRVYAALIPRVPHRAARGDLLARLVSDVDGVQDLLLRCLLPAVVAVLVGGAAVAVAAAVLPAAALVLVAGLLVTGCALPVAAAALTRRAARRTADSRGALAAHTVDLLDGAADLAAYGATAQALERADAEAARLARLERATASRGVAVAAAGVSTQGLTALGVTVAATSAAADGRLPAPLVAVLAVLALSTVETMLPLADAAHRLQGVRAGARRLVALLDSPHVVPDPRDPEPAPDRPVGIDVRGLRVSYPGRGDALAGIDLNLPPGSRVAVVGPSGSGKSTLLAALVRFVSPAAGRIAVNGVDIAAYAGDDVRRVVNGVLADAHVFHAPIRDNIAFVRPGATDAEVRDVLRRVNLATWVDGLPAGLGTVVGADGRQLSGGQRQRLLLARALLADPAVLLLDEPTEGLDPRAADALLADIATATRGRSVVLVTHRLSGLASFDEIVVLTDGRVRQRGRHRELARQPGPYQDLWHTQQLSEARYHRAVAARDTDEDREGPRRLGIA